MIDLEAIEYTSALWYVAFPGGDWMAAMYRERGDRRWHLKYRFRYYSGSRDPFDQSDRKNWYQATTLEPDEDVEIAKIDFLAAELARAKGSTVDRVDVRGDKQAFMTAVASRPWMHVAIGDAPPR